MRNGTSEAGVDGALLAAERFRSLAHAAPAMLWMTEPDGSCSFLSRDWREFTGLHPAAGRGAGRLDGGPWRGTSDKVVPEPL